MHFAQVRELRKCVLVSERDEDDAMVSECRHGVRDGAFLSTTWGGRGDENTGVLSVKGTLAPEPACCIPEGLSAIRGENT